MKRLSAGLKSSSPLLKQGAPTELRVENFWLRFSDRYFRPGAFFDWNLVQSLRWQRLSSLRENPPVEKPQSAANQAVPHISLVFRKTTDLDWQSPGNPRR